MAVNPKRTKSKKRNRKPAKVQASLVRTDKWVLFVSADEHHVLGLTVEQYRLFVRPLVIAINSQWHNLETVKSLDRFVFVEKMFIQTAKNPTPKHSYFANRARLNPAFLKFPSYLRRAAINEAMGIVSSFRTRYDQWQRGIRSKRSAKPPSLTAMSNTYPALYRGQSIKYHANGTVEIKVWNGSDWVWLTVQAKSERKQGRHLNPNNVQESPTLVVNANHCRLSVPFTTNPDKLPDSDYVCAVDLGINNTAVASIVGKTGTVKARLFIDPARDIDRRDKRATLIRRKAKIARRMRGELFKGFCSGHYRKSANINKQIAQLTSRRIVDFASRHGVSVIVFENLSYWKAKGGRKRTALKQRFHRWCKDAIVRLTRDKWSESGGQIFTINAAYTSAYAYDGSGKLKRAKENYSQATFTSGKQYNADLSASYNIGARYWYAILNGDKAIGHHFTRVWEAKDSSQTQRIPVTLSSLWLQAQATTDTLTTSLIG